MALEYQRYGRNKETLVNKSYIESGEYRRKFDMLTDNPEVNKTLYDCAKKALFHRSGTELEDMYWIDSDTGKIIAEEISGTNEKQVVYSAKTVKLLNKYENGKIIALHSHPGSMPPSIADFNSCFKHGYKCGYVACHNGKIFMYTSKSDVRDSLYNMYIGEYVSEGKSEYDAQILALSKLQKSGFIDFKEVN